MTMKIPYNSAAEELHNGRMAKNSAFKTGLMPSVPKRLLNVDKEGSCNTVINMLRLSFEYAAGIIFGMNV